MNQIWPLLWVNDIDQSLGFYTHKLGFDVVGRSEEDGVLDWCRLERGGASIMLQRRERGGSAPASRDISLYVVCDDAAGLYNEFKGRGMELSPPTEAEYGMLQLFVPEPDGYALCFESPTDSARK